MKEKKVTDLRWFLTSKGDEFFLDKSSVPVVELQNLTKARIDVSLKTAVFDDVEDLKSFHKSPDRFSLEKLTINKIDDAADLSYLLRFSEVKELCLPILVDPVLFDLFLKILPGFTSLRKLVFMAQSIRMKGDVRETIQKIRDQLPEKEIEFQFQDQ